MIQDITPHEFRNEYIPEMPKSESIILYYEEHVCLVRREQEEIYFPTFGEMEKRNPNLYEEAVYLFSVDSVGYYLVQDLDWGTLSEYALENTEIFRSVDPLYRAFAGITGYQLYCWYQDNRYCGRCGSMMRRDEELRMVRCDKCNNLVFPTLPPAVIIGITDGDRIIMSKYNGREYKKYALIAGYAEIGETIEDTVRREVMEEVGLKVKNIRYYKSQPWSFSGCLLMGFFCDLDGEDQITLEEEELSMAAWFQRDEIPVMPNRCSLTNEMIIKFKNGEV